ncbi:MAG: Clp protease N-terminal domain-containing protein, partial [Planctomycetota bacterium]
SFRPEKLYDTRSVANIDVFAENCGRIVRDVFNWHEFSFLMEEDIDYIAEDIAGFVRTYTRDDVPGEIQLMILESLDTYLHSTFLSEPVYKQEGTYLKFDNRIKTLKLKLWQVIATEPLTEEERATFAEQKHWIFDFVDNYPVEAEIEGVAGRYRAGVVFNDILNGFSTQPMSQVVFSELQEDIRNEDNMGGITNAVSCWSTEVAMEDYKQHRRTGWAFPFGVVTGVSGGSDRVDFRFESEKPYLLRDVWLSDVAKARGRDDAYDISSRKWLKAPDACTTQAKLKEWLAEQDAGDFYYDEESESIVGCRGARMAVLDVNNWIESDLIGTEELRGAVRARSISRFSVSPFKSLDNDSLRDREKPVVPIIAIESGSGDIALLRPMSLRMTRPKVLRLGIRHRFEGWDDQWFGTFITGESGYPVKRRRTVPKPGYTERAGEVMRLAEVKARGFKHTYVGTEHILLALEGQFDTVAWKVLRKLGIDGRALGEELKKLVKTGTKAVTQSSLPQTPLAKKALEHARSEAKALDHNYIGTEHILLGLMQEKDGVGARMLVNLGVSYDVARAEVLGFVKPGPGASTDAVGASKSRLVARLAHGGTLELVAVRKLNLPGLPWHSPDGRKTIDESDEALSKRSWNYGAVPGENVHSYEFFVHGDMPHNRLGKAVKCRWRFDKPAVTGGFAESFHTGRQYFGAAVGLPNDAKSVGVTLEVSNGPWKTLCVHDRKGEITEPVVHRGVAQQITLGEPVKKGGSTHIEVGHNIREMATRIIVIEKNGRTRRTHEYSSTSCIFNGITPERIERYEFQVQPIDIVTFEDISLKDAHATNPRTKADSITADLPLRASDRSQVDSSKSDEKYLAKLANGVTVELLGVCEHPSEGKRWWAADGQRLSEPNWRVGQGSLVSVLNNERG